MFDIIVCDPPWEYGSNMFDAAKRQTSSAETKYLTTNPKDFHTLPLKDICSENCLLFMWVTGPQLQAGMNLMDAWGFKYVQTPFVWHKEATCPGSYTNTSCEFVLLGKRGKIPERQGGARNERQLLVKKRSHKHSEKPEEIQDAIERMFPNANKLELFARRHRGGWTCTGNELDGLDVFEFVQQKLK